MRARGGLCFLSFLRHIRGAPQLSGPAATPQHLVGRTCNEVAYLASAITSYSSDPVSFLGGIGCGQSGQSVLSIDNPASGWTGKISGFGSMTTPWAQGPGASMRKKRRASPSSPPSSELSDCRPEDGTYPSKTPTNQGDGAGKKRSASVLTKPHCKPGNQTHTHLQPAPPSMTPASSGDFWAAVNAGKSAKRRAAEALLAARFGGAPFAVGSQCHGSILRSLSSGAGEGGSPAPERDSEDSDGAAPFFPQHHSQEHNTLHQQHLPHAKRAREGLSFAASALARPPAAVSPTAPGSARQTQDAANPHPISLAPSAASAAGLAAAVSSTLGLGAVASGQPSRATAPQPHHQQQTHHQLNHPQQHHHHHHQHLHHQQHHQQHQTQSKPASHMTLVSSCAAERGCGPLFSAPGKGKGKGKNGGGAAGWCDFDVQVPSLNWQAVFDEPPPALPRSALARGYEKLAMPEGLSAYVVENPRHVEDALARLKGSMKDRVIAIDLEWRPEHVAGRSSPVALMQLASATTCVMLRISSLGYSLPAAAAEFLSDPSLVVLGCGWDGADERKMLETFGMGRARFKRFVDLQDVASLLGYQGLGLARLSSAVLGCQLPKSKSVSRSNWAAPHLTNFQLKYAALDVLVAGQLFRALRLWHSSPSPCSECRHPIGELVDLAPMKCRTLGCGVAAADLAVHQAHCVSTGHVPRYGTCEACKRVRELQ